MLKILKDRAVEAFQAPGPAPKGREGSRQSSPHSSPPPSCGGRHLGEGHCHWAGPELDGEWGIPGKVPPELWTLHSAHPGTSGTVLPARALWMGT